MMKWTKCQSKTDQYSSNACQWMQWESRQHEWGQKWGQENQRSPCFHQNNGTSM